MRMVISIVTSPAPVVPLVVVVTVAAGAVLVPATVAAGVRSVETGVAAGGGASGAQCPVSRKPSGRVRPLAAGSTRTIPPGFNSASCAGKAT
jgi:hypothetical protein